MNVGDNYNRPKVSVVTLDIYLSNVVAERIGTIVVVNNIKLPCLVAIQELVQS